MLGINVSIDQDTLVASFSGAVAYLCTRDKMPLLRAFGYVVAGTATAAYIGSGISEWAVLNHYIEAGPKAQGAVIFASGVGGIWLINLIVAILQAAGTKAGDLVSLVWQRMFGPKQGGQ